MPSWGNMTGQGLFGSKPGKIFQSQENFNRDMDGLSAIPSKSAVQQRRAKIKKQDMGKSPVMPTQKREDRPWMMAQQAQTPMPMSVKKMKHQPAFNVVDPRRSIIDPMDQEYDQAMDDLSMQDAVVELQDTPETDMGGEPGVGVQGFGRRALMAAEGELVESLPPIDTPDQTDIPVVEAQSDLQRDPNLPPVTPQDSVMPDINYIMPAPGREETIIGFVPNAPGIQYTTRGPLSRNLTFSRGGFPSNLASRLMRRGQGGNFA